jgi:hypothetical protein
LEVRPRFDDDIAGNGSRLTLSSGSCERLIDVEDDVVLLDSVCLLGRPRPRPVDASDSTLEITGMADLLLAAVKDWAGFR